MKKMYKAMLLVLCAILLVAGSVMGTLAYLKAQTGPVKNTFTVGNVAITLDEAKVNEYGVKDGDNRITAATTANGDAVGNTYKLIPGHEYTKDPTIHVGATSEDCWLFVKLVNGIVGMEAAGNTTIAKQMEANGWKELPGVSGVYYHAVAKANDDVKVFEKFVIDGNATVASAEITITAYAVQEDGFVDKNSNGTAADEAWIAASFS